MEKQAGRRVAERPPKQKRSGKKLALVILLVVVLALGAGYTGLCAAAGGGTLLPNTSIAGVDLGGLSQEAAVAALDEALPGLLSGHSAEFTCDGRTYSVSADDPTVRVDTSAAVAEALDSQSGGFFTRGWQLLASLLGGERHPLTVTITGTPAAVNQAVEECADPEAQTTWEVTDSELVLHKGVTGRTIDTAALIDELAQRLGQLVSGDDGDSAPIETQVTTAPPADPDFDAIRAEIAKEPADAYLDKETKEIIPSVTGVDFDPEAAKAALDASDEGGIVGVPLTLTEPNITTAKLEANLFKDVLGKSSTRTAGGSTRWHNVDLACQRVNGTILLPGETFSYNDTVGPYSQAGGYQKAGAYVSGTTKDTWAGGVCQLSSTLYWTTLKANLETVERHKHQFDVGYLPSGMDATVYSDIYDFKFKNNTDYPILIETSLTNSGGTRYCNVTIYGTDVTGVYGDPYNVVLSTIASKTVYEPSENVPQGSAPQRDPTRTAYTGKKVEVHQRLRDADGNVISDTVIHTDTFASRDAVYYYNPADAARLGIDTSTGLKTLTPVNPTPSPSTSAEPSATPSATPSSTPSTTPSVTPTPAATPSAAPSPTPTPATTPTPESTPPAESSVPPSSDPGVGPGMVPLE